jgi:E3 ubiquitin-protein ligase DMA1/2
MFTQPAPAPPTLATSTSPVSPASPHRPSRLRGLSYLRNFNPTHLHSRDNHSDNSANPRRLSLGRATGYPSPTSNSSGSRQAASTTPLVQSPTERGPPADKGNTGIQENIGSAGGWLPTVGGQSAVSRIATPPKSTPTDSSSGLLAARDTRDSNSLSATMGRTRSANTNRLSGSDMAQLIEGRDTQPQYVPAAAQPKDSVNSLDNGNQLPSIRFSQHQDVRAPRPSLVFSSMSRTLPSGRETIRVGRYSERENQPGPTSNVPSAAPIGFKSKVVSRRHCEFWFQDGQWFIKDVKSSSGTFLNHVRLSSPGTESKPFPVKDGDIVQLGIDFKGGEEMIFRCVKIRIELNRGWQSALNSFK